MDNDDVKETRKYGVNTNYSIKDEQLESTHIFAGQTRVATKLTMLTTSTTTTDMGVYYYHPDHLGSSSTVTDKKGNFYEHNEFFPYGEVWVTEKKGEVDLPFKFTSKELDSETGLYYYGARYMDPKLGRWCSVDPAAMTGEYFPNLSPNRKSEVQNKNLPGGGCFRISNLDIYHYAANNPVVFNDPDGRIVPLIAAVVVTIYSDEIKQVAGAAKDFVTQYNTMRKENIVGNDHYNHAMANSKATQRGSAGEKTAVAISFVRELVDHYVKGDTIRDSMEDNAANKFGRDISKNESPVKHNEKFDTRRGGQRVELPDAPQTQRAKFKDFLKAMK